MILRKGQMYKNKDDGFIFITEIKGDFISVIVMSENGYNCPEIFEYKELEEAIKEYNYTLV